MKHSIKEHLLKSALGFFQYTQIHRLLYPLLGGIGTILVLHRVIPETGEPRIMANSRIEIDPSFLEQLIQFFIGKNYDIISLDSLFQKFSEGKSGRPFVCFTFDDGYTDAYEIIYPIFKKYHAPFTVYVTTCFPERTATPWWYMLETLVQDNTQISFTYHSKEYTFDSASFAEKEFTYNSIRTLIMSTPLHETEKFIQAIFSPYRISVRDYDHHLMNWQQIKSLAEDPLSTIGAHTENHYNLTLLTTVKVKEEILKSKSLIEQKTGIRPLHFAYPFGSRIEVGKREINIASQCGFKTMTTVREGNIFAAHGNHLNCLPRIEVTGRHQDLTVVDMRRCGVMALLRNGFNNRVVTE